MIIKSSETENEIVFNMVSEDGQNSNQCKIKYIFKKVKKGIIVKAFFDKNIKICTDYDCAFSLLDNTMPKDVYCCVINMPKKSDENYSIIREAAERLGFKDFKSNMIKEFT